MRRVFGAAAILFGSFLWALCRQRAAAGRIDMLRALSQSLLELRSALQEQRRPLGEVFSRLAEKNAQEDAGAFYETLRRRMDALGERSFSQIWREAVEAEIRPRDFTAADVLRPLGALLGGSELDGQCAALERAARRIEQEADARREALRAGKKLSYGLSLSAGAFLAIILM